MNNDLRPGQVTETRRCFSQSDFDRFAILSGDDNPIHVDPEFAARTKFGKTVAHGMLLYSVVSAALDAAYGPGVHQVEQSLMFPSPTYAGEEVVIRVEVKAWRASAGEAEVAVHILRPGGQAGLQGATRLLLPQPHTLPFRQDTPAPAPPSPARQPAPGSCKGITLGQVAETQRVFSPADLAAYVDLVGDANPLYTQPAAARRLGLDDVIVPGGLLGGLFSYLLGTRLPGRGANYLKQRLRFGRPAHPGQKLTARVEVTRIRPEKQLINLATLCLNDGGEIVCRGEALVLVSDVADAPRLSNSLTPA